MGVEEIYAVGRQSIWKFIVFFFLYIALHMGIAYFFEYKKKELEKSIVKDKELEDVVKWSGIIYKWFPAIYVVIIIMVLLL